MATISTPSTVTSGTISSTGLGTGLDINGLVSKLITAESQPIAQLNTKEAGYQAKLTAYGTVKSALSSFQSAVSSLETANTFQSIAATSGDSSIYTASADTTAVPGTYSIEVSNLAQSQKLASSAFSSVDDVVGTGTLTFQFGTDNGGTFTANSNKSSKTVTIDSSNNTLSGVRDAINAAGIGVSATIINDGTGYRLSLTSTDTGAANSLKITSSNDADGNNLDSSGLSQLVYDPAGSLGNGKNLTQTVAAQDAVLNVDGITNIKKSSNTVTDLIQGVTLNLHQASTSGATTLTVAADPSSAQSAVQKFVSAYNDLHKTLSGVTAYDATTQQGGILLGDSTILTLERQLRSLLTTKVAGASGNDQVLSNIGVSFQKDGTLSLDSNKLETALAADPTGVASLFATIGTTSDSLTSFSSATSATQPGSYAVSVSQLATQGSLQGSSTSSLANTNGTFSAGPIVLDSTNNTFAVQVDGTLSGTITLTPGSYSTASELTAEIQSKINGDSTLAKAGSGVKVSFDNATSKLTISSNRYGSASNVVIMSAGSGTTSTLGLSAATGTAGIDVAGTINGVGATGSGQYLTGALGNAASGLKIQVTGGDLGYRGTVNYSKGYANQLDTFLGNAIGATGPIKARTDGINRSVTDINDQITAMKSRLATLQQQYLKQFNAMDTLVAQMKSTSDFLTQQLASLASVTPTGK